MKADLTRNNRICVTANIFEDRTTIRLLSSIRCVERSKKVRRPNIGLLLPSTKDNFKKLIRAGVPCSEKLKRKFKDPIKLNISDLKADLREYQKEAVLFMKKTNGNCLIADDMGLGKTIQVLAYILKAKIKRVLVVCPGFLKYNWESEIHKFTSLECTVLSGRRADPRQFAGADIHIINYDILSSWVGHIVKKDYDLIVFDEVHFLKGLDSKRTKASVSISDVPRIIGLSGTPIESKAQEIFSFLHLLMPEQFPKFKKFAKRYCGYKADSYGYTYTGKKDLKGLYEVLKPIMIRRHKTEVLEELPSKQRIIVPVELDNYTEYEEVRDDFTEWYQREKQTTREPNPLNHIEYLQQTLSKGKEEAIKKWIKNFLLGKKKLLVFGIHTEFLTALAEHFNAPLITGKVPSKKRFQISERFQNDKKCRLLFGNIKAMGVGLNLTAASDVLMTELWWVPGVHTQAEDRVYRFGQKNACSIYYMLGKHTVEPRIFKVLNKKFDEYSQALDDESKELIESDSVNQIMRSIA